jgi:hypothetical protein
MSKYTLGDITKASYTNDWSRVPRATVIGSAILSGLNLGSIASSTFIFGMTYATVVGQIAITLVTSVLMKALMPKPKMPEGGTMVNARGATNAAELVYGQVRKGGTITYIETTGSTNKILHQIIVLAAHEVQEIGDIYFNDEIVTMSNENVTSEPYNGYAKVYKHRGNQTSINTAFANSTKTLANTLHQEVNDDTNNELPTDFIGKGVAYLYCRFVYNQDAFAAGLPTVTAVVKGKKVVRTVNGTAQTAAYSANPAWCVRDFLTSSYGLNDNQIDYATFEAAADICDETQKNGVDIYTDGSKRYEMNGTIQLDQPMGSVLTDMVATMGGSLFWGAGYWKLYAGSFITPTKTLTLDDFRSGISIDTRVSMRDNFNKVTGTFNDKEQDWISADYPAVTSSLFLADDNNVESALDFQLPFTTNNLQAQLLAKQTLMRSREQITLSADFSLEALDLEVGDFVKLEIDRYGWGSSAAKTFEVVGWRLSPSSETGDIRINLSLRESSENAYGFTVDDEKAILSNNSTLLRYYEVPDITVSGNQEYREVNQNVVNVLAINVTSDSVEQIDSVIVQYKKATETNYKTVGQAILVNQGNDVGRFEVVGIDVPDIDSSPAYIDYDVKATPVNGLGYKGATQTTTVRVTADNTPPAAPTNLQKELSGGTLFFSWDPVADLDLSHYTLWYSSTSTASFGDASLVKKVPRIARPATSITAPAISGAFFVSAVDKTGNESNTAAKITVAASELPSLGYSITSTEHSAFSGIKSNATVSSGQLFMTTYNTAGSTGTYDFHHGGVGYIDVGAARTIRLSNELTMQRKHANAVNGQINWDDIPQNWDTWPQNFDDWTSEQADFADFSVNIQARAASTVAGLTSAPWVGASGEIVGHYVEFRATLSNTNANVSPSITALTAKVEY